MIDWLIHWLIDWLIEYWHVKFSVELWWQVYPASLPSEVLETTRHTHTHTHTVSEWDKRKEREEERGRERERASKQEIVWVRWLFAILATKHCPDGYVMSRICLCIGVVCIFIAISCRLCAPAFLFSICPSFFSCWWWASSLLFLLLRSWHVNPCLPFVCIRVVLGRRRSLGHLSLHLVLRRHYSPRWSCVRGWRCWRMVWWGWRLWGASSCALSLQPKWTDAIAGIVKSPFFCSSSSSSSTSTSFSSSLSSPLHHKYNYTTATAAIAKGPWKLGISENSLYTF